MNLYVIFTKKDIIKSYIIKKISFALFQVFGNARNECFATSGFIYARIQRPEQRRRIMSTNHRIIQWTKETLYVVHGSHDARWSRCPEWNYGMSISIPES